ncbi:hypothetical protein G7K_3124-t1 [Saitoella complicata NRRL Y-17804]|uniref:Uncharacterized protein n=1 Tax=Saitoella complicata (strain BCRC 22490 / CBS 7301 / JCM 7358 / NBRC 10748 / NRRL Y-17804) TaxID=698492 RepID=A0A0E9NGN4_SAICN|nr:hypothetical protein G7K_3124-t1 [Saitoella complicata NRRL Y-17804]
MLWVDLRAAPPAGESIRHNRLTPAVTSYNQIKVVSQARGSFRWSFLFSLFQWLLLQAQSRTSSLSFTSPRPPMTVSTNLIYSGVLANLQQNAQNKKDGIKRESALIGYYRLFDALSKHPEIPATPFFLQYLPIRYPRGQRTSRPRRSRMRPRSLVLQLPPRRARRSGLARNPRLLQHRPQMAIQNRRAGGFGQVPQDQQGAGYGAFGRAEASETAITCMRGLLATAENLDIKPHLPLIVECMANPTQVPACIKALSAQAFVAEVNAHVLAILVPILVRALNERSQEVLRQTVIVADNLCRLVKDPFDAARF